ncbi:MAG TPA: DinB family protein, partial [Leptospiraceae bacterium]|nr:DinB family protein [Leptospiraceae bacterium]
MRPSVIASFLLIAAAFTCSRPPVDFREWMLSQMEFNRAATDHLLDELEKTGKADEALAWRAGTNRAPLGWQLMHLAASEDRQATRLGAQSLISEKYAEDFKSGKPAVSFIPKLPYVRQYLKDSRASLQKAIRDFDMSKMDQKVPETDNTFRKLFQIILW